MPRRSSTILALCLAAGFAMPLSLATSALAQPGPTGVAAPKAPNTDDQIPVRKITLYRSGVGYFERSGNVSDNAEIQLRFKTEQINDILKSMILLDLDGGRIESVSYGSKEPLAKRLAAFGINIADNPTAADILQRLRGTAVKITTTDGEHSGTIMNVEKRQTVFQPPSGSANGGAAVFELPWINLLTDKGVRSYDMTKVSGFEILDKELASELNKALSTLAEYRADTTKTVDLRLSGAGSRRVVVGYVNETPVWKTSYRLVLPDADPPKSDAGGGGGKTKGELMMQGWAIVENTTDQDWTNVRLSLVSGRPVSFQMDLYEPLYTYRPMVAVPTIPGVNPRAYAEGMNLNFGAELNKQAEAVRERAAFKDAGTAKALAPAPMLSSAPGRARGAGGNAPGSPGAVGDSAAGFDVTADDFANYSARSQAQGTEVGEVFQYQVEAPVTVERQRSAMIPIISSNITGRRVSIFSQGEATGHPMRGVELVNETNLQLLPGPIAVFDGAAYAGDAQINQIAKGDKRLLSYSLDLDVNVITKPQSDATVRKLKIVDGSIIQTVSTTNSLSYAFDNKDAKRGRTIVVEHPRFDGWTLKEPAKAAEETKSQYRFELDVEPGKTKTFSVIQERTEHQSMAVTSIDMETVVQYHKNGKLSDAVLKAIQDVGQKQSEINTQERAITELDRQKAEIDTEQNRIRENMGKIDRASQLYTRYMTKLSDQESSLEDLRDKRKAAQVKLEQMRAGLNEFLRTLNAE